MLSDAANRYIAQGNKLETTKDKLNFICELFRENIYNDIKCCYTT